MRRAVLAKSLLGAILAGSACVAAAQAVSSLKNHNSNAPVDFAADRIELQDRADRAVLTGILFVLKSGLPWEMLPKEMGCGCGMTCWRRLRDWQTTGVWAQLHRVLLDRLGRANAVDWSRCAVDSAAVAAKRGANRPARTRPIAVGRVPSVISWSTPTASRSPFA